MRATLAAPSLPGSNAGRAASMSSSLADTTAAPLSTASPPPAGKKVPDYWDASKRLLADPSRFLESLLTFDKDNIPDSVIKKARRGGGLRGRGSCMGPSFRF